MKAPLRMLRIVTRRQAALQDSTYSKSSVSSNMNFSQRYDETSRMLESRLTDLIDNGSEFDLERAGDVLTIEFENGDKIIITPNSPVEQLWISAEYQGHRFNWSD